MKGFYLTSMTVHHIKKMIWDGAVQADVADEYKVSLNTINRIVAGMHWYEVPWPDGSVGFLPDAQKNIIMQRRQSAKGPTAFRRSKQQLGSLAARYDSSVSEKEQYMQKVMEGKMPGDGDLDSLDDPDVEWIPADRKWAQMMWDIHMKHQDEDAAAKERRDYDMIHQPAPVDDTPPITEEQRLQEEEEHKATLARNRVRLKGGAPDMEVIHLYYKDHELEELASQFDPKYRESIMAVATDRKKALKKGKRK